MKKLDEINIYYSRIVSIPVLNYIFYKFESWLIKNNLTGTILMSGKQSPIFSDLIDIISKNRKTIIIKSYKFGPSLRFFNSQLVLDLKNENYKELSKSDLGLLMWTLVYTSYLTKRTKRLLKFFVTSDFPTKQIVNL